jgi:hypothetical protein
MSILPDYRLQVDFINGPLLVSFFSIPVNLSTMEEKTYDDHSGPERALYRNARN